MSQGIYYCLPQNVSIDVLKILLTRLTGATIDGYIDGNIQYDENGIVKMSNSHIFEQKRADVDQDDIDGFNLNSYEKVYDSNIDCVYKNYVEGYLLLSNFTVDKSEVLEILEQYKSSPYSIHSNDIFYYMFHISASSLIDNNYSWPESELNYPPIFQIEIGKKSSNIALFKNVTDILGGYILFSSNYNGKEDVYLPKVKHGLINCEANRTEEEFKKVFNQILINAPFINADDIEWANKRLREADIYHHENEVKEMLFDIDNYQIMREKEEMEKEMKNNVSFSFPPKRVVKKR